MGRKLGSCRRTPKRKNLPFSKKWQAETQKNKKRTAFPQKNGALVPDVTGRARPAHASFRREMRGADSRSSDLHSGNRNFRVRLLPSHRGSIPAMAGFRPERVCFLWNRPRAHSSGRVVFPFSCAGTCQGRVPVTVHRMVFYEVFRRGKTPAVRNNYTRKSAGLQGIRHNIPILHIADISGKKH